MDDFVGCSGPVPVEVFVAAVVAAFAKRGMAPVPKKKG